MGRAEAAGAGAGPAPRPSGGASGRARQPQPSRQPTGGAAPSQDGAGTLGTLATMDSDDQSYDWEEDWVESDESDSVSLGDSDSYGGDSLEGRVVSEDEMASTSSEEDGKWLVLSDAWPFTRLG